MRESIYHHGVDTLIQTRPTSTFLLTFVKIALLLQRGETWTKTR